MVKQSIVKKTLKIGNDDVGVEILKLKGFKRVWILGDVHFGVKNNSDTFLNIQMEFFENFFESKLKEFGANRDEDLILFLGDVFDNRHSIQILVMNKVLNFFKKLSQNFDVYIIAGNHDLFSNYKNDISSLSIMFGLENVKVFLDTIGLLNFEDVGKNFLLKPWHCWSLREDEFIQNLKNEIKQISNDVVSVKNVDFIATHTNLIDKNTDDTHLKEIKSLEYELFSKNSIVFNGHIHRGSVFENVFNCGSLFSFDFGDYRSKKFFCVLDLLENKVNIIENDYSPTFDKFKLDQIINLSDEELFKKLNNKFLKIYINTDKFVNFDIQNFNSRLDSILKFYNVTYNFYSEKEIKSKYYIENENGSFSAQGFLYFFELYIKSLLEENEDKKYILNFSEALVKKIYENYKKQKENSL